jgi:hypothetical protein
LGAADWIDGGCGSGGAAGEADWAHGLDLKRHGEWVHDSEGAGWIDTAWVFADLAFMIDDNN